MQDFCGIPDILQLLQGGYCGTINGVVQVILLRQLPMQSSKKWGLLASASRKACFSSSITATARNGTKVGSPRRMYRCQSLQPTIGTCDRASQNLHKSAVSRGPEQDLQRCLVRKQGDEPWRCLSIRFTPFGPYNPSAQTSTHSLRKPGQMHTPPGRRQLLPAGCAGAGGDTLDHIRRCWRCCRAHVGSP